MKKNAYTLVELIVVVTIVIILATMMVGIFNSTAIYNKARDAQRKKDLGRIKVAFEEYYNDTGCFPSYSKASELNLRSSCNSGSVFGPWLNKWPCDPNSNPYFVVVDNLPSNTCNQWFKVMTKLENKNDPDIPSSWHGSVPINLGDGLTSQLVNFGVSSTNKNWYEIWVDPACAISGGGCFSKTVDQPWNSTNGCVTNQWYTCASGMASETCKVDCCGVGCN